jgi:hypothetical protein
MTKMKMNKIHGALGCILMSFALYTQGLYLGSTIVAIVGALYCWADEDD